MNDFSIMMDELAALPTAAKIAIGVLYALQVGLQIYALVDLWKTPVERVQTGKKWIWAAIILLVNMIGAIIYLVAGKKPTQAVDPARQTTHTEGNGARADRATAAADLLYGSKEDQ